MDIALGIVGFLVKLAVGIGIAVSALLGGIFNQVVTHTAQAPAPVAAPTTVAQNFPTATTTPAQKPAAQKPVLVQTTPVSSPAPQPAQPTVPQEQLNLMTRQALVNIECTTISGGAFNPISGSGIVIDSRGIILTNAHVGQFFLLRNYGRPGNINCVIRTGSPATNAYTAELLYLPPAWVDANAPQITSQQPTGTGENDFALLRVTGTIGTTPMPASFARLALSTAAPDVGQQMLLAAYPAGFLSGELIATQLYASSAFAYVTNLFSFDNATNHVDLFSVGGSIESQSGSSGGAVVNGDGKLVGLISTATVAAQTGQRDLRAITVDYINNQLKKFGQGGLEGAVSGDLSAKAAAFNNGPAVQETAQLTAVLDAHYKQ